MSTDKFKDTAFIDIKGLTHFFENLKEFEFEKLLLKDNVDFATNDDILSIFKKNNEEPETPSIPINLDFYFIANKPSTLYFSNELEYSLDDGNTWNTYSANTALNLNTNDAVGFKGELSPNKEEGIGTFSITGDVSVYGNPEVLLVNNQLADYAFSNLFNSCTGLTDASGLEFNYNIDHNCYAYMFAGCINLTKVADLPATTPLPECYAYMFAGCTSLTKAPEIFLNNTNASSSIPNCGGCMNGMFQNCTSLNYIKCHMPTFIVKYSIFTLTLANNWVSGVSSTGTYYKPVGASIETGESGIPKGWDVIEF